MKTKPTVEKPPLRAVKYMRENKITGALEEAEILAETIADLAEGFKQLLGGRLSKRAIVLLIHDACKGRVGKPAIEDVLETIPELARIFLRAAPR